MVIDEQAAQSLFPPLIIFTFNTSIASDTYKYMNNLISRQKSAITMQMKYSNMNSMSGLYP